MIANDEVVIIYDQLSTAFDVQVQGGMLRQKKESVTGEFTVDRTLCPLSLCPTLYVTDPNVGDTTTDQTSMLVVNWYLVTSSGGTETESAITTTSDSASYYRSGKNLIVQANVQPGNDVVIRAKATYVNPHTLETLAFRRDFVLTTESYVGYNPGIEVNIPHYTIVSPFKLNSNNYLRTVTATLFSGTRDISSNAKAVFVWEKKVGSSYRAIASTDVDVASVSGRNMVLNLACISLEKYRVTAYHSDYAQSENRRSYLFTVRRQMDGFSMVCRVTSGKYLRQDTPQSQAEALLTVNSNVVDNPLDYFHIRWWHYLQSGISKLNRTFLNYGTSAVAGRSLSGYDRTKRPTFEMEYVPLTEYRTLADDNGETIIDENGEIVVGQFAEWD